MGTGLGARDVRALADRLGIRPTKTLGQNFVIDANTCRRIVQESGITAEDVVLEIGPGLGSLTLALLDVAREVIAVEIDPLLADALPETVSQFAPEKSSALRVLAADALTVKELSDPQPTALVANLPYNVAVPVLLNMLEAFPSLQQGIVMVQSEVADRLAAPPGSRTYGVPSVKAAWWADVARAGAVGRSVFWPAPNVDSGLVRFVRRPEPAGNRKEVFAVIDAAFAQRRKTLRAALAGWAGGADRAEEILRRAGISPQERGEQLTVAQFTAIAAARESS
jgi:16S rRNA (adenine1518-N6/adenine1519-N6)-dimethyltransferase